MTNRLSIDSRGLRISKPGFDVLTTGAENLLFNSDLINARVLQRGTFTLGNQQTFLFGTSYPFIPLCTFYVNTAGGWRHGSCGGPAQEIFAPPKPYLVVYNDRFVTQGMPQMTFTFMYILAER